MSTQIAVILGKTEIPDPETKSSQYEVSKINVTRFWGGNNRGVSLQFTIGDKHIQLDEFNADKLTKILSDWKNAGEQPD